MMTAQDIVRHNQTLSELTAEDGIPRLTWQQHSAAFEQPVMIAYANGVQVVAWDSATAGIVGELRDGKYDVRFPDVGGTCRYSATQLRPLTA